MKWGVLRGTAFHTLAVLVLSGARAPVYAEVILVGNDMTLLCLCLVRSPFWLDLPPVFCFL